MFQNRCTMFPEMFPRDTFCVTVSGSDDRDVLYTLVWWSVDEGISETVPGSALFGCDTVFPSSMLFNIKRSGHDRLESTWRSIFSYTTFLVSVDFNFLDYFVKNTITKWQKSIRIDYWLLKPIITTWHKVLIHYNHVMVQR